MVIDVPSGAEAGRIYLVNYDEDLWKAFDAESQQFCKDTWIKKATPIPGVKYVVLRLHPDDLFPMHGNEKPYVEWKHEIDRPPECGFTVEALVTVTVQGEAKYLEPVKRSEISRALEGTGKPGTPWRIVNQRGDVLEHGRL